MHRSELNQLHKFIEEHYSLQELNALCFTLGIRFDNLTGANTINDKARELLLAAGQERLLETLLSLLKEERPDGSFPPNFSLQPHYIDTLYAELSSFATQTKSVSERLLEHIFTTQVLAFTLIFAALTIIVFSLWLQRPQEPAQMSGDFRIAIAGFTEYPTASNTGIGIELAEGVYLRLQESFRELDPDFTVSMWGPDRVRAVQGSNENERADAAAKLAEEIKADLIIYGVVYPQANTWQLQPEFYVSTANFNEAAELTGPHKLGAPLSLIQQNNIAERIMTSNELTARTQILSQVAIGLAYYAIFDYEQAHSIFASIINMNSWEETRGQEVIYLLIGNAAMKNKELEEAEVNYRSALQIDPHYSRGYLGIAGIHYLRALQPYEETLDRSQIDLDELEKAIINYNLASASQNQPSSAHIPEKIRFGLGQVYLAQALAGDEQMLERAASEFIAVTAIYAGERDQTLRHLTAESYARLGLLHTLSGNSEQAVEAYETAVSLLYDTPDRQSIYQQRIDELKSNDTSS